LDRNILNKIKKHSDYLVKNLLEFTASFL